MPFHHPPAENQHSQQKRRFARPARLHYQEQHGPDKVKVFLDRERPEVGRIKTPPFIDPQGHVIAVEQQTTRQVGIVEGDDAQYRHDRKDCQRRVVRGQDAKASPNVEPAQADIALYFVLPEQKSTNKEAADGKEDVDAKNPVSASPVKQRALGEEARPAMEKDDSNDRHGTPAVQGRKVRISTTQLRLRIPDRGTTCWRMPVEAIRWETAGEKRSHLS
jgi:hypothetical protein